mgnify:CR=1 FL=1
MSSPFVAEIRIFAEILPLPDGPFVTVSYCLSPKNTALFLCLGRPTAETENLISRCLTCRVVHPSIRGRGAVSACTISASRGGSETVTLLQSEIPAHNHTVGVRPTGQAAAAWYGGPEAWTPG